MPLVACTDDDDAIESQRSDIVRYLTSTHVPRLISAEDAESSLEVDPPFYDAIDRVVYRYIYNYYDEGRDERSLVEWGDEVELTYTAYVFTGGVPRIESIYASNDADVIEALVEEACRLLRPVRGRRGGGLHDFRRGVRRRCRGHRAQGIGRVVGVLRRQGE